MDLPRFRASPEEFLVEEIPLEEPSREEGPHLLLRVEKRLANTHEVAREIARLAALPDREVGFAGRKDRHAVARQWFSLPRTALSLTEARSLPLRNAQVLEVAFGASKLRLGDMEANRFRVVVNGVGEDRALLARETGEAIGSVGMPNRYGRQRFGRSGLNAEQGLEILRGESRGPDRRAARFLLSALQSAVFNRVLATRPVPLNALLPGDLAMVHLTGALVPVRDPDAERTRLESFAVSPTGPLFGTKMRWPQGQAQELERKAMESLGVPWGPELRPPKGHRLPGGRRLLRVRPEGLSIVRQGEGVVIEVTLPSGSYVTTLLEELFPGGIVDGATGERL